jgi:hypothetical protein
MENRPTMVVGGNGPCHRYDAQTKHIGVSLTPCAIMHMLGLGVIPSQA